MAFDGCKLIVEHRDQVVVLVSTRHPVSLLGAARLGHHRAGRAAPSPGAAPGARRSPPPPDRRRARSGGCARGSRGPRPSPWCGSASGSAVALLATIASTQRTVCSWVASMPSARRASSASFSTIGRAPRARSPARLELPLVVDRVGGGDHAHDVQLVRREPRQVLSRINAAVRTWRSRSSPCSPTLCSSTPNSQLGRLGAQAVQRPELIE